MSNKIYGAIGVVNDGGANPNSLDNIDGAGLVLNDMALVLDASRGIAGIYRLVYHGGGESVVPMVIKPLTNDNGYRWMLVSAMNAMELQGSPLLVTGASQNDSFTGGASESGELRFGGNVGALLLGVALKTNQITINGGDGTFKVEITSGLSVVPFVVTDSIQSGLGPNNFKTIAFDPNTHALKVTGALKLKLTANSGGVFASGTQKLMGQWSYLGFNSYMQWPD